MLTQLHGRGLASLGKVLSLAERWTVDFRKLFLCRFVQTGLLRREITRLGASNQTRIKNQRFLRFAHLSLIFHSTTSRETSALLFVNTSPSQETLLSSPKALPTGEEKYIGNTSQVQYWVRSGERSCRVLDQSNPVEHLHWFL